MFVYVVVNRINGKKYVGQHSGTDLNEYWKKNVYLALNGYEGKRAFYRAIRKHGPDAFDVRPLVIVSTKEEMDRYEMGMIKAWDTTNPKKGYNITLGGSGSLGVKQTEEQKRKKSLALLGGKMPESHRQKLSERSKGNKYGLGHKMTKENFDKLMAVHIGAKRSIESRIRMSIAHLGKHIPEDVRRKMAEAQVARRIREAKLKESNESTPQLQTPR